MIFSAEMLHEMKLLRQYFKEEGLGVLKLADPDVLDNITAMARASDEESTKNLAYKLLREAGRQILLRDLYPVKLNKPKTPKVYRGVSITGRTEEQPDQLVVTTKNGTKILKGNRVA